MSDSRTYVIEALRPLSDMTPGRDTLTERTVEAWVPLDTVSTSDAISWNVFEEWFNGQPEDAKAGGRYRLMMPSDPVFGSYHEYVVSPSWRVEMPHIEAAEEVTS